MRSSSSQALVLVIRDVHTPPTPLSNINITYFFFSSSLPLFLSSSLPLFLSSSTFPSSLPTSSTSTTSISYSKQHFRSIFSRSTENGRSVNSKRSRVQLCSLTFARPRPAMSATRCVSVTGPSLALCARVSITLSLRLLHCIQYGFRFSSVASTASSFSPPSRPPLRLSAGRTRAAAASPSPPPPTERTSTPPHPRSS